MSLHHMLRAAAQQQAGGASDPYFEYNTLLLTGDGTNGAQNNTFLDSSTNNFTITRNGNTTQGTFSPYGNLWSNYFDGSGDYLSVPSSAALDVGSGDFTIEMFAFPLTKTNAVDAAFGYGNYTIMLYHNNTNWTLEMSNNGSSNQVIASFAVTLNAWQHIAIVKSGTSVIIYKDGVSSATGSISGSVNTSGKTLNVGRNGNAGQEFTGHLSNFRVVKGTALYTSNFTPSTTPLTAVSGTSLLTCQSNRFIDNSSNNFTLTVNGNTSVQRFSPFNPTAPYSTATIGGSGYFDGSGDYLQVPSDAAFNFGTGEFTVEAWVNISTLNTDKSIIDFRSTTNSFGAFYISGSGNVLGFYDGSVTASGTALVAGAWCHVAYVRTGTTLYAYLNGVQQWSRALSTNITSTGAPEIGADFGGSASLMNGYISNLRVVKGTAVYTSNFTPPTAPLTAITNTSLLLNFTNAGIPDAAMMNDLETVGNAQVSTSVVKYGTGSLKFDGTNTPDRLLLSPPYTNYTFGTGDFTIEAWIYITTGSRINGIYGDGSGGSRANYVFWVNTTQNLVLQQTTSGTVTVGTSAACPLNQWVFITACKVGTTAYLSINGNVETFTGLQASASGNPVSPTVGDYGNYGADRCFAGYIDDFRITKGYARYTSSFTPPTAALPTY